MRKERKGGCALSVALWSLCCRGLCRVGAAWQMLASSLKSRSLLKYTLLKKNHLSGDLSQVTRISQLHVVDHATSIDPRCMLFS